MCWSGDINSKVEIALEDIEVYKVGQKTTKFLSLQSNFKSILYPHLYERNVVQPKVELKCEIEEECLVINEGYHSFKYYTSAECVSRFSDDYTGLFVIPKGTRYYDNDTQIVSETIIFKKFI